MSSSPSFISLPVAVRAYASDSSRKARHADSSPAWPSDWTLVFDTETSPDAAQQLRFGAYQVWEDEDFIEEGLFYDPNLPARDLAALGDYLEDHKNTALMPLSDFIEHVFYHYVYDLQALCVGFNLPFDISRIALSHDSARRAMKGGFTFRLSDKRNRPRVQVKHLNSRTSLIRFGLPWRQLTPRGMRKRRLVVRPHRGLFLDLRSFAGGILSGSWNLRNLADFLETRHRKLETDYDGPIDRRFIEYALNDVEVTRECFEELRDSYQGYGLSETPAHRIYSEASLGKAYLNQMGVRPWREVQPEFPPDLLGAILGTYYGGRAEVRIRRKAVRVVYCDFMSMYPTVCTLMGLWQFVTAKGMTHRDSTGETRELLSRIDIAALQKAITWRHLQTIVQVQPDEDIFPVRARYGEIVPGHDPEMPPQHSIGLNHLSSSEGHWFTLADCIASVLLTGRPPKILRAVTFEPGPQQDGLRRIRIAGNREFEVDPTRQDFYKTLIELRIQTKKKRNKKGADPARIDAESHALKICANATSYGIFVELNVSELDDPQSVDVFGGEESFLASVKNLENEGRYFHPLLGTLITGAARLMIAIAERLAADEGISWAFCDTDSMALAQPEGMTDRQFLRKAENVREWFTALSPYEGKPDLFKLEDQNFSLDDRKPRKLEPLLCWAVSAKRYALFNIDAKGQIILRKASAHGLGHLTAPYDEKHAPKSIPAPRVPLKELGVERWQHDLWIRIIAAGLSGEDHLALDDLPGFDRPAASRYAATTPAALRWFKRYNETRPYDRQVRPFGFLYSFPAKKLVQTRGSRRGIRRRLVRAVAPYGKRNTSSCFDRESGARVSKKDLATYAMSVSTYHLHPEDKFENADYDNSGTTLRRHIMVVGIEHIGKESNRWEDNWHLGSDADSLILYGSSAKDRKRFGKSIRAAIRVFGIRRVAAEADLSPAQISAFVSGKMNPSLPTNARIRSAVVSLGKKADRDSATLADLAKRLGAALENGISISRLAQIAGCDPANLRKGLKGLRRFSLELRKRLEKALNDLESCCRNPNRDGDCVPNRLSP